MRVTRIKRTTAADEVFKSLHGLIISGQLRPGDKLPSQRELAESLEVSRSTLREAIHKLMALGYLEPRQGVGTRVSRADPLRYMSSLPDHFLLDGVSAAEFLEARLIIESAVAKLAVKRASARQRAFLKEILERQARAAREGQVDEFSRLDTEFHLSLARLSGNRVLVRMEETILDLLRQFIRRVSDLPGAIEDALVFHSKILEALEAQDPEEAQRRMASHLADVAQRIKEKLGVSVELPDVLPQPEAASPREKGGNKVP
ncbi:MAG: FadR/GntR family transcriptional regulator [Thermodesulfobacteriota bacterium]